MRNLLYNNNNDIIIGFCWLLAQHTRNGRSFLGHQLKFNWQAQLTLAAIQMSARANSFHTPQNVYFSGLFYCTQPSTYLLLLGPHELSIGNRGHASNSVQWKRHLLVASCQFPVASYHYCNGHCKFASSLRTCNNAACCVVARASFNCEIPTNSLSFEFCFNYNETQICTTSRSKFVSQDCTP